MIKISKLIRTGVIGIAATVVVLGALPARATDFDQVPQGTLNIGKVDFNAPRDVNRVISQLRRMALDMCTLDGTARELMSSDAHDCYNTAIRNGMAQIHTRVQMAAAANGVHVAQGPVAIASQK